MKTSNIAKCITTILLLGLSISFAFVPLRVGRNNRFASTTIPRNMVLTGPEGKAAISAEEDLQLLTKVIMQHMDVEDGDDEEDTATATAVLPSTQVIAPTHKDDNDEVVAVSKHESLNNNNNIQNQSTVNSSISSSSTSKNYMNDEIAVVGNQNENQSQDVVQVGSKEYYSGFINRNVNEEPVERVSGDKLLIPILKFIGSSSVVIGGFLLVFLASNGLLFQQ